MLSLRASHQIFFGISALLFLVSTAFTIHGCTAMMDGMPMPGGWTMSMTWMPGQNGVRAMLSFLGMWVTMMIAMMLPSLLPMLWRYRQVVGGKGPVRLELLTALAATGYFLVWVALGIAAFPIGVALAALAMQYPVLAEAVPVSVGAVILVVGALQFTTWKSHHLACCRSATPAVPSTGVVAALRYGLRLGRHCATCCSNLTLLLLVVGIMDLRVMAVVTVAMTAERLAGERMARAIGAVVAGAGLFLTLQATGVQL